MIHSLSRQLYSIEAENATNASSYLKISSISFLILILVLASFLIPTNVYSQSKLKIDLMLPKASELPPTPGESSSHFFVNTPKWSGNFSLTGAGKICPSGNCKGIIDNSATGLLLSVEPTNIRFWGVRLLDNDSNSKFSPMKRALVENIRVESTCNLIDIKEDQSANSTTYICGKDSDDILLVRNINDTNYFFVDYKMSLELPSRHLLVNATEEQ